MHCRSGVDRPDRPTSTGLRLQSPALPCWEPFPSPGWEPWRPCPVSRGTAAPALRPAAPLSSPVHRLVRGDVSPHAAERSGAWRRMSHLHRPG